jgi:hypothetical protein
MIADKTSGDNEAEDCLFAVGNDGFFRIRRNSQLRMPRR